jgi:hypothetical protein
MEAPTTRKSRVLKGCLGALGVALLAVAALASGFWWSLEGRKKQAVLDGERYGAVCDSISTIAEHPAVSFSGFTKAELGKLTFYLIRNGKILKDTVLNYPQPDGLYEFNIPLAFASFKKTDTIVVATTGRDKRFYQLAGFHYVASLHYGMMGYVGGYDCHLAEEDYTVNGRKSGGFLRKQDGLSALPLPARWK